MKSLVLVLVFLAWFVTPAIADFDAGMAAYQRTTSLRFENSSLWPKREPHRPKISWGSCTTRAKESHRIMCKRTCGSTSPQHKLSSKPLRPVTGLPPKCHLRKLRRHNA